MRAVLSRPSFLSSGYRYFLSRPCLPTLVPRRVVVTSSSRTAPIDLPKTLIPHGSALHNSLSTFLEHAARRNLNPESTLYVGTLYEYQAAKTLRRFGFALTRTGRKSDAGIDLAGYWCLPTFREPLPVILQCKSSFLPANPAHIRELEGSMKSIPTEWHQKDVLALLVSVPAATSGVMHAMSMSRHPLGFLGITRDGTIEQFFWNRAASERGLEGVGVTVRHTPTVLLPGPEDWEKKGPLGKRENDRGLRSRVANKFRGTGTKKDIQLTWLGSPINSTLPDDCIPQAPEFLPSVVRKTTSTTINGKKRGRRPGSKDSVKRVPRGTYTSKKMPKVRKDEAAG